MLPLNTVWLRNEIKHSRDYRDLLKPPPTPNQCNESQNAFSTDLNAANLIISAQTLQVNQLAISASETHQIFMRAALHNLALVKDIDDISLLDST